MFTQIYFPPLAMSARQPLDAGISELIMRGRFSEATRILSGPHPAGEVADDLVAAARAQLHADLDESLSRYEDAEETYSRHRKILAKRRDALRIASFRNNGWKAFFVSRLKTASASFQRVMEDKAADAGIRLESMVGAALVQHQIGNSTAAARLLHEAGVEAVTAGLADLATIIAMLRVDVMVQQYIRGLPRALDHSFWSARGVTASVPMANSQQLRDELQGIANVESMPVVAERRRFLLGLLDLADAKRESLGILNNHLRIAEAMGLADYDGAARLDIALVLLSNNMISQAAGVLERCKQQFDGHRTQSRCVVDYLYRSALTLHEQGRLEESMKQYRAYTALAIESARTDSDIELAEGGGNKAGSDRRAAPMDEFSSCLPGKYRRAYQYLMTHLHRPDLSIPEIANEIGVTGRSLQMVFKSHLGLSPSEVVRARRLERIHEDIVVGRSVLDAGANWGIRNRSTLLSMYKSKFNETPTETLRRGHGGR